MIHSLYFPFIFGKFDFYRV